MSTELALIEPKDALQVFSTPKGLDAVIDKIEAEVKTIDRDISTEKGRDNIRSIAFKLAKSKNALDKMGKDLTEEQRAIVTAVNAERSRAWDRMEALQAEIRKPLTDWENAEKDRVAAHEAGIAQIEALATFDVVPTTEQIESRLAEFTALPDRDWQEFSGRYKDVHAKTNERLQDCITVARQDDANRAELARLQAEEHARLQKEREDKIASDAKAEAERVAKEQADALAAKVKADTEAAAKREQDAIEAVKKAEADKIAMAAKAESDRLAALEKAEADKKKAEQAILDKLAAEKAAEDKLKAAREADIEHKKKINNEALVALSVYLESDQAKQIVTAIAKGEIPHIKITY